MDDRAHERSVDEGLSVVRDTLSRTQAGAASPDDLVTALTVLRELREQLAGWEPELVAAARAQNISWAALAPALGVTSRQAAERRYLRLQPSDTGERTGEERVRAERDKRAGDRAVAAWARDNAAALRQLAGRVSSLRGLSQRAQHHVDLVTRALAEDDPASLLPPLADTHSDLKQADTGLAAQVQSVTDKVTQVRDASNALRAGSTTHADPAREQPPVRPAGP